MDSMANRRKPRLERRNAGRFEYEPVSSSSSMDDSTSPSSSLRTRSLELGDRTSFRIEGNDGEFDQICRSLGLSGIDDFAIPTEAWQASKIRSSSDLTPRSRLNWSNPPNKEENEIVPAELRRIESAELPNASETKGTSEFSSRIRYKNWYRDQARNRSATREVTEPVPNMLSEQTRGYVTARVLSQMKGTRPPMLKPPPSMTLPVVDNVSSTWDICRGFAPHGERDQQSSVIASHSDEEDSKDVQEIVDRSVAKAGETVEEQDLFTTSNDDDTSSSTTEPMNVSPNGRIKRTITHWQKGDLLGSGSFGSVYEGIAE